MSLKAKKATKEVEVDSELSLETDDASISDKIDKILQMQKEQDKKTTQILANVVRLEEKWEVLRKEIAENSKAIQNHDCEISRMKESLGNCVHKTELSELKSKLVDLENRSRRNNLIFWNIPEHAEDQYGGCGKFIEYMVTTHMKCTEVEGLTVERAHRTRVKSSNQRPIHAKFINWSHKERILRGAAKLLKTNPFQGNKIFISDDVSREVREERALLKQHLGKIRSKDEVSYAYIPWSVPAKIICKLTDDTFKSVTPSTLKKEEVTTEIVTPP